MPTTSPNSNDPSMKKVRDENIKRAQGRHELKHQNREFELIRSIPKNGKRETSAPKTLLPGASGSNGGKSRKYLRKRKSKSRRRL
jgi:hypothetical protein